MKVLPVELRSIPCIEGMRFAAAFLVVLHHAPLIKIEVGKFGVDLFFIISGFVMMYSTELSSSNFMTKRIVRILPIYWSCTFALFILALSAPWLLKSTDANLLDLLKSLFFIPFDKNGTGHFPVLSVGWTLNFEMYFYLIFAVSLRLSWKNRDIITAFVIMGMFLVANVSGLDYPLKAYGDPMVLEFLLGMLSFRILTLNRGGYVSILAILLALLASTLCYYEIVAERILPVGLPIFVAYISLVYAMRRRDMPNGLLVLGGASYALYLIHTYVLEAVYTIAEHLTQDGTALFAGSLAACLVSVIASVMIFRLFERPVTSWLRRKVIGPRPPAGPIAEEMA